MSCIYINVPTTIWIGANNEQRLRNELSPRSKVIDSWPPLKMKYTVVSAIAILSTGALSKPLGEDFAGKLDSNVSTPAHLHKRHWISILLCPLTSTILMLRP
jgi:hypothetical protein